MKIRQANVFLSSFYASFLDSVMLMCELCIVRFVSACGYPSPCENGGICANTDWISSTAGYANYTCSCHMRFGGKNCTDS